MPRILISGAFRAENVDFTDTVFLAPPGAHWAFNDCLLTRCDLTNLPQTGAVSGCIFTDCTLPTWIDPR